MEPFKVIIVEDVPLELKGTEGIIRSDIPEAEVIGTADNEIAYWRLIKQQKPDLVLLDLGLGGSTTVGVEICRQTKEMYPQVKVLIFTGEILNEKLWVDVLDAGADGIILKSGEMLTRGDVRSVMEGKQLVFNEPILRRIVERFCKAVNVGQVRQESLVNYEIDEYDERFLRHLALGYTKDQITQLRGMPFGVKSLEKRQNELVQKLFPDGNGGMGVNATRLVVRAIELRILDIDNLVPDEE
ncbi:MAG: response regulator transcription factor [Prevotella sp.]|jgi:DNA-binding NarL/FixJ family response regulator|nr:response regulator transcription factor [Prevotella sp.]